LAPILITGADEDPTPSLPSWRAISKPIPLLAPVTSAIRFFVACMANSSYENVGANWSLFMLLSLYWRHHQCGYEARAQWLLGDPRSTKR
jgi:hypothetical protein